MNKDEVEANAVLDTNPNDDIAKRCVQQKRVIRDLRADIAVLEYEKADLLSQLKDMSTFYEKMSETVREREATARAEIEKAAAIREDASHKVAVALGRAAEERDTFEARLRQQPAISQPAVSEYQSEIAINRIAVLEKALERMQENYYAEREKRLQTESKLRSEVEGRRDAEDLVRGLVEEIKTYVGSAATGNDRYHADLVRAEASTERWREIVTPPSSLVVGAAFGPNEGISNSTTTARPYNSKDGHLGIHELRQNTRSRDMGISDGQRFVEW
jgi:hypothetical protein